MTTNEKLTYYKNLKFEPIELCEGEKNFYKKLNNQMIELCRSLPHSMQTEALLFIMNYAGIKMGENLDLFKNYVVPVWSILYWITEKLSQTNRLKHDRVPFFA